MSVIIRLQNLPWSANSLDIRHYFRGLSIPEGGVHIVGGEMGDAFIAFSTDEDARQAMMLGGGKIKEVQISLMLSSRSEMQKIIEAARQASMSNSLAQLLAPPAVTLGNIPQQPVIGKDPKSEKKDSSDLSSSSHETGNRRDRRDRSRSRSRDRSKRDRRDRDRDRERERDRDRDRDRRRRSRSRSRSRDRRRRRSRSRSKGRDSHTRDRERKDIKDDNRKEQDVTPGAQTQDCGVTLPSIDILNTTSWNVMQPGSLAQNPQLLTNFELLRNLASQKGPLIPGGPNSILGTPIGLDKNEVKPINERFTNRSNSPLLGDAPREDFVNRGKGENGRGRGFKNFDDGNFQDNKFGDGRFDRNRGTKMFPNFNSGFSMRNGVEPPNNSRFGNFGRSETGFSGSRGPGPNRDRPNPSRGLLDFPTSKPQPENRPPNTRQDRFSNRDDRVDEFGRSIQLRNRKNLSDDEREIVEENKFQGNQQNFSNFGNRPGPNQPNQRPFQRGRDWQPGGRNVDGFPDRRGFRGSFVDQRFRGKGRDMFGKFDDDSDIKILEKDCCVEIRNLAPHIAYGEVRRPFSNFKLIIKEIKFFDYGSNDKKCRIRFLNSENKRKAIQVSSKIIIDHRPVHLIEINDSDFEECIDEGVRRPELRFSDDEEDVSLSPKDAYIQIKDLSPNVEESDIAKLFPNAELDKVLLEVSSDGKSKSAFIKFQKAIDAKVALGTPNRSIGDCIVFLTPLPQYIFNDHLNKSRARSLETGNESPEIMEVDVIKPEEEEKEKNSTNCILMKNLPLEANDRDICDFFSDIGLVPNKIHLMLDVSGQSSGVAFCEFSTSAQIERACSKNSAHLGKNIVSVVEVPRSEMLDALGIGSGGGSDSSKLEGFGRPHCVVALENIPFKAGVLDIIKFFGWSYKLSEQDILRRYNERGQPTGDARVCFRTPEDAQRAIRFQNNRKLMERNIRMKLL